MTQLSHTLHDPAIIQRLDRIEVTLGQLLSVLQEEKTGKPNAFEKLFNSQEFESYTQRTISEYQQDKSQFVNPFTTFSK